MNRIQRLQWQGLIWVSLIVLGPIEVSAIPSARFELSSYDDFKAGKLKGVKVSSNGSIASGVGVAKIEGFKRARINPTMIWSLLRGKDGSIYAGTADQGKLLRIRGNSVRVLAKLPAVMITALTWGPNGQLFLATMPGARILTLNPRNGKWRQFGRLSAEHIWALHFDRKRRILFAASGAPGKIFALAEKGGAPRVHFDPKEDHLLFLTPDKRGNLLSGGSRRAILYRVSPGGKGFALHDFPGNELRSATVAPDGAIYVAVNRFPGRTSGVPRFKKNTIKRSRGRSKAANTIKTVSGAKFAPQDLRSGAKVGRGALYRLSPQGRIDPLLALRKGYFTHVAPGPSGTIWAAEGTLGRVYQILPDRSVATVIDLDERQILRFLADQRKAYVGTGDPGALYRISPTPSAPPSYTSAALDAKFAATWGRFRFRGSGTLKIETRSGNTKKADSTWSSWKTARPVTTKKSTPRGTNDAQVLSPPARYLQFRVIWRRAPYLGIVRAITVFYRPQNQRARVEKIKITAKSKASRAPSTGPLIKVKWTLTNPDSDPLVFRLYYAEEENKYLWQPLHRGKALRRPNFVWDTHAIPDGVYRLKVVASDEGANGPRSALKHTLVSQPIAVDNQGPEIIGLGTRGSWVHGIAEDASGPIQAIHYAIDNGPWRMIDASDGVYDELVEEFRIQLPRSLTKGRRHIIAVRARDQRGNSGIRRIKFTR